ncbi:hypothetical protein Csp1_11820 [Corynebacterium provencense]|jgi:hypothetical protein|uniref:DUF262 domain-containing protein n=1 Tax=Corynebacterium provencense TaxID=1737425 RepID=A0A2Z3YNC5_9CORY|nr:DUF262 domain-containing protein [Corynebacterium provencense]AWT25982.1 hypothetical protein Csp1_11820 [Corynebacterium provencense]MCI1255984.1 DUF262 domain-containing protein [Corynebacterium provencense]
MIPPNFQSLREIFQTPVRIDVPLFQRPYVWTRDTQWEPLWEDITRLTEDSLAFRDNQSTHFLGAVVLQSSSSPFGGLPRWIAIDGQQRLTTLQIILNALHRQLVAHGHEQIAAQVLPLVENPEYIRQTDEDRYKLWPTNKDRAAFVSAMTATYLDTNNVGPTARAQGDSTSSRLVPAHQFFTEAIDTWLHDDDSPERATALVSTILDRLRIVNIQLDSNEDAQAIFETLNARGTPLSAADLIKNFVFQNLDTAQHQAEDAYANYWEQFETDWWEKEITYGRVTNSRSSWFLWQWLIARTLTEFPIREVFRQFKNYVATTDIPVSGLLPHIKRSSDRYRSIIEGGSRPIGELSRPELFSYRISTLDSEITRPLLIWLDEPEQSGIPQEDKERILVILEGWLVRRALVKVPSQGGNRLIIDLMKTLSKSPQDALPSVTARFLTANATTIGYWPSDHDVRASLVGARAFQKYRRDRLRMVLEAVEDNRRGYPDGKQLSMGPIPRGRGTVEHLMPQKWRKHWPADLTEEQETARDSVLDQIGNLTLLTQKLNSKVSNGAWTTKRADLINHDDVLLTRDATALEPPVWDEEAIEARTCELVEEILTIWPVPEGCTVTDHVSGQTTSSTTVTLKDLVRSGILPVGTVLHCARQNSRWHEVTATVTADGGISLAGTTYTSPSMAARAAAGSESENGWIWWAVVGTGQTLDQVRAAYRESTAPETNS